MFPQLADNDCRCQISVGYADDKHWRDALISRSVRRQTDMPAYKT